jgi:H+/Cl- antiporter ClcA
MFDGIYQRAKNLNYSQGFYEHTAFIAVGFFSGLICCTYAILFSRVEKLAFEFYLNNSYAIFGVGPLLLLLSFLLIRKISPGSTGSGIPQVMVCISEKNTGMIPKLLGIRVIIIKITSSLLAVFSGAAIGREGPSIQISASVGYFLNKLCEKFRISVKRNQMILAGSAGGLAAAFNTPIGGIVYAIEELSYDHIKSYKTVLLMSVLIAGFTAQLFMGNYLYLGFPKVMSMVNYKFVVATVVEGFVSGIMGGLFSNILFKLIEWRRGLSLRFQLGVLLLVGVFLAIGFHEFGFRNIFSGKESIHFILYENSSVPWNEVLFRFFSPLLSSMTGIAGGIFAPSLSAGATLGGFLAQFIDPEMRSLLGLVGMIGFLNGVTKAPITSFVIVLEMTDRHSSVFPMMLSALFSTFGSFLISHESFYELMAHRISEKGLK